MVKFKKVKHGNSGECAKCLELLQRYGGVNSRLQSWFFEKQRGQPNAHVSEGVRGKSAQEAAKRAGNSRASFGESAHNYGLAIDVFFLDSKGVLDYSKSNYLVFAENLPEDIEWLGTSKKFPELPHFELKGWRNMEKKLTEVP